MARQMDFRTLTLIRTRIRAIHTGNERVDRAVHALTGGRAAAAMNTYEQFIGISEVKAAQNRVAEIEQEFLEAREKVAAAGRKVSGIQTELHAIRSKLDRTPRDDPKFLELATEEHRMLQNETKLIASFDSLETKERDTFSQLSAAVRESHEKQRAQEERTKYWSVIGSVVGTLVGIVGSTVVSQRRMRELRTLVTDLGTGDFGSEATRNELTSIVHQLKESLGQGDGAASRGSGYQNSLQEMRKEHTELLAKQLAAIKEILDDRNTKLTEQLRGIRRAGAADMVGGAKGGAGALEELLSDTEQKLEWEMKMSTLSTVVFIYGAFALTLPILYSIFK